MTPICSVVIATRNRSASLERTLQSVLHQQIDAPYEVIVVDNGSTDDTAALVGRLCAEHPELRYAFEAVPGPSAARNTGVSLSRSDLVAFTDDDIRPSPTWLASLTEAAAAWRDIDCFGGRILPVWPTPPPAWLTQEHWTGALALQDYGDEPVGIDADTPLSLATANMAIRRRTFLAFDGFSVKYLFAEDTELLVRLWRARRRCLYLPDAVVFADIQPERMHKPYHRHWHRRNGQWAARMGLEESFNGDGRLRDTPSDAPTLFGVPAYLYRQLGTTTLRYGVAAIGRRHSRAFQLEKQLWQLTSYMRACAADRTRRSRRGRVSELTAFAIALVRKKVLRLPSSKLS